MAAIRIYFNNDKPNFVLSSIKKIELKHDDTWQEVPLDPWIYTNPNDPTTFPTDLEGCLVDAALQVTDFNILGPRKASVGEVIVDAYWSSESNEWYDLQYNKIEYELPTRIVKVYAWRIKALPPPYIL